MPDIRNPSPREPQPFVPALRYKWATGLYDQVIERFTRGKSLRRLSVAAAVPQAGETILDLGCGTGDLTVALAESQPDANITGYDIDPAILAIARAKLESRNLSASVKLREISVDEPALLPIHDIGRFDCVVSSLVFHHLTHDQKQKALKSVKALLRPGGRFVLIDWGPGTSWLMKAAFWQVRMFDGMAVTADNALGTLPALMDTAGFSKITASPMLNTIFGTVWLYHASI